MCILHFGDVGFDARCLRHALRAGLSALGASLGGLGCGLLCDLRSSMSFLSTGSEMPSLAKRLAIRREPVLACLFFVSVSACLSSR